MEIAINAVLLLWAILASVLAFLFLIYGAQAVDKLQRERDTLNQDLFTARQHSRHWHDTAQQYRKDWQSEKSKCKKASKLLEPVAQALGWEIEDSEDEESDEETEPESEDE